MKSNVDPKMAIAIVAVVVVGAAFLVYRGASANAKTPLPDPNMFKVHSPSTPPTPAK